MRGQKMVGFLLVLPLVYMVMRPEPEQLYYWSWAGGKGIPSLQGLLNVLLLLLCMMGKGQMGAELVRRPSLIIYQIWMTIRVQACRFFVVLLGYPILTKDLTDCFMDSQTFGLDKGGENDNWAARFCTNLWFTNVLNGPYQIVFLKLF